MNRSKGQFNATCTIATRMTWMAAVYDAPDRCV
jgi:hypothetical protein